MSAIDIIYNRNVKLLGQLAVYIFRRIVVDRMIGSAAAEQDAGTVIEPAGQLHLNERATQVGHGELAIFQIPHNRIAARILASEMTDIAIGRSDQMPDDIDAAAEQAAFDFSSRFDTVLQAVGSVK